MTVEFPEGEGIFETIKTIRGAPFALTRHLARATRSGRILGMKIPVEDEIRRAITGVLSRTPTSLEYGRLRISFHPDGEFELIHETYHPWTNAARLTLSDSEIDETSPLVGLKTLPFTENIASLKWAHQQGFDDAIRFNTSGDVVETSIANVLLKIGDRWITPNLASGCLPGITRELALEWLNISESVVSRADLDRAESIYLLSSLKDAQPVSILEDRPLEIDTRLRQELADRMAQDIDP